MRQTIVRLAVHPRCILTAPTPALMPFRTGRRSCWARSAARIRSPRRRFAAITELAVFEAVNACTNDYEPYLGTITAPPHASADAAAIAAAHRVLRNYFPASAADLDARASPSLSTIPDGRPKRDGIAVGEAAAAAMIAARANDGSAPLQTFLPDRPLRVCWQPTPPAFGPGNPAELAQRDALRHPQQRSVSRRLRHPRSRAKGTGATSTKSKPSARSTAVERPQDRTDVARSSRPSRRTGLEHGGAAGQRRAEKDAVGERARLRAPQHGDQRCARLGVRDQVPSTCSGVQ